MRQNPRTLASTTDASHPGFRRTLLGAALVVLGVSIFAWVVWSNTRSLLDQTARVEHTREVIGEIEATFSTLKDAETDQRGYLLTGDESYLRPYEAALPAMQAHLDRLQALTADNPAQQKRLVEFEGQVRAKLAELADAIRLRSSGNPAARRTVGAGSGQALMSQIRRTVDDLRAEENRLLAVRSRRTAQAANRVTAAAIIGGASFLALFTVFLSVVRADLLGRARAQAAALEIQERLTTTLRSIGDAVLATDVAGRVTFLNPVAESITGWTATEAVGRTVEEVFRIVNESTRAPGENPVRRVIREGVIVGLANHTLLISRGGHEFPIADSGAPIRGRRGEIVGVVLVFRDVSEQRRAEQMTRRLAAIVASADYAIVAETVDNVITHWNPGAEAIFGYTASEMIGRRMSVLAPPESPDPSPALTAELRAGRRVAEFDARRVAKDGRWLDVVITLSPILDEEGSLIGVSRLIRDVTERRRHTRELHEAQLRAEEANSAKDRFLATLSHELRTPLTPVMASVHRLERRADLGPGMAESLAMIRRNVELEARLIDDLLDLTRISRGKIKLERAPLDLHLVLRGVVQSSRSEFFNKGLQLTSELSAEQRYCSGDSARLQQVFWNLLKNSAKFTPAGGQVVVRSENPEPGRIRVTVTDSGRGISPDLLPRIFEAFEQGEVTAVRRAGGLGLGLAIARSLVELHGGSIAAESEGEGRGATFSVELATTAERPEQPLLPTAGTAQYAARHRTSVLIVEDDVDTGEALQQLLAESGFDVRAADSVAAATRLFRERPAGVLVTDVGLPDGSGLELLGALKAFNPELRAIVLSGYGMEEDLERSRALGFTEHFVKPLNLTRLIAALDALSPNH